MAHTGCTFYEDSILARSPTQKALQHCTCACSQLIFRRCTNFCSSTSSIPRGSTIPGTVVESAGDRHINSYVSTVTAMDHAKFKRVVDTGFARRHRKFQLKNEDGYVLRKESLQIDQWRGFPAVTGVLIAKDVTHAPLVVAIMIYGANTFRVVFDDLIPPLYDRCVLEDVVLPGILDLSLDEANLLRLEENAELVVGGCNFILRVQYEPFAIYLVQAEDSKVLLSINNEAKLMMEAFMKKSNADDNFVEDGHWEETHNGFTDPKLRGPKSMGVDISFPFAKYVYGIPERTASFSLRDTADVDGQSLSEPYRLYNLDVSGYELDDPLGLYGAVPLLIGRDHKTVAGIF